MLLCKMIKNAEINRNPEVIAGIFLLLTGFSIIITLLTDIKFLSAISSLSEDIEYLNENNRLLHLNSVLWIVSAFLMIITASSLIAAIVPHQAFLGYLQGFFLFLAAAMFCVAGVKGLSINDLLKNYHEIKFTNPDSLNSNILTLSREKDIYLTTAYNLIGLSFFVFGIFAYITLKIPVITGIFASLTGVMIPVFTLIIPDSILTDTGLIMACFMFFILTVRFLFKGLEKKKKRTRRKRINTANIEYII
jgi:hypothetical protein